MDSAGEVVNDGKITLEGFSVAARAFADKWKRHNLSFPSWSWVPLINRTLLKGSAEEESLGVTADWWEKEESIDHTVLVQNVEDEAHYYDYHIVYSASYMVPMLYFRGYSSDGKPLSLDVIKRDLPSSSVSLLLESKWTFITQEIRLGLLSCGSKSAVQAVATLVTLVSSALLVYISTAFYAFWH
ncbi:hypothetical protein F2Q69_00032215 [Brassica cretica]|uniref:Ubiquitin-like-conjugating enzyme ATG10 n=1 Tax=Brassica cretica TaxID=69181 RepID=A0A8S9RSR2_BRACR|nr:hypothetical protein F2Q69_00032215 [Brassica cretica]